MPLPFSRRALQTAPSFSRDFAGLKTLDHGVGPAITFTRASNATFFDANGTLQTAANDTPRFDHDPATAGNPSRGLLIEEARTNLFERSAEFDNAVWVKAQTTISANTATDPSGATTADKLVEDNTANNHFIRQEFTPSATGTFTVSCFAKKEERDLLVLQIREGATTGTFYGSAEFNLTSGTVTGTTTGTATIQSVGSGWYRCVLSASSVADGAARHAYLRLRATSDTSNYTGDGTSGLYIWGAQLEAGAFATSYIPTTTAAATRSTDQAFVNPISSFHNASEGTLFVEANTLNPSSEHITARFREGAGNGSVTLALQGTGTTVPRLIISSPSGGTNINLGSQIIDKNVYKLAGAYSQAEAQGALNGVVSAATATGAPYGSQTHLLISRAFPTSNVYNSYIRKIAYWPRRLSNSLLQQLTT